MIETIDDVVTVYLAADASTRSDREPTPGGIGQGKTQIMPLEKVRKVLKLIAKEPLSLETPIGDEENSHLGDFIEEEADRARSARGKRRFRVATTDSKHGLPIAPNVLDRKFIVAAPNQAWVGDLTYIATDEGWLFLAVVIDLFSRKVVGWSMRPDMQRNLVIDALEMAWFKRNPGKKAGLIFHSDRGSQYASDDFSEVLKEHGITPSMSRKGNCWDNACSETLFGSLKVERLHGQRFETIREAKDETIAWLLWYNRTRMHSTLNYVSPMQFEQDWMDATVKIAA